MTRPIHALTLACIFPLAGCGNSPAPRPHPGDPLADVPAERLFELGGQYASQGDLVRGEQYLALAIRKGYPEAAGLPKLIEVCVRASRLRAAIAYAEPSLQREPDNWRLRLLVASLHIGVRDIPMAQRELAVVLRIAPDQPSGHYISAVISRDETQETQAARAHFQRYLELAPDGNHASEARAFLATHPAELDVAEASATHQQTVPETDGQAR